MTYKDFILTAEGLLGTLSEAQRERFRLMEGLYKDWNGKINVISRKDIDELYLHHVLHSLAIAVYMEFAAPEEFNSSRTFLDVGTGGGFPGIPLAILFPDFRFTLCDSIGKKITVATDVAQKLGLSNVSTICCRAENINDTFDYVVSRAVAPLDKLYTIAQRKCGGGILCLKGGNVEEEIISAMNKFSIPKEFVFKWEIKSSINIDYFNEKYVIFIKL